jgi:hypothetical protein
MSEVTNLIISFYVSEDEISRAIEINYFHNNGQNFHVESANFEKELNPNSNKTWYGGNKYLETPLYIGAINHLDLDGLVEFLKTLQWEEPENVQIIIKEQFSDKFRIIEF